jgi:tetratricopeptide (TPR) repeat protein
VFNCEAKEDRVVDTDGPKDFFVSYNKADREWAEWIAWKLEAESYTTVLQAWDFLPGTNFVLDMDKASQQASRTIALLSPDYLASQFTQPEWAAAFAQDPTSQQGKLLPIRIRACALTGLLAQLVYLDLVDLDEKASVAALHTGIARTRLRPSTTPRFPGNTSTTLPQSSHFPGPSVLPRAWNVPFRRNPFFTGREFVFTQLHELLHAGTTAALSQPPAISGLGGIGKTQTAVEYAYRFRDDYQFVLWVQANTQETLLSSFVALAKHLNLPEQNDREQQVVVQALKQWLETRSRWLLIVDNADDLAIVQDYLPEGNEGHILFTTRAQAMSGLARKIDLDTMETEEGAVLLLRRASLIPPGATLESVLTADRTLARDIVEAMGGLPLALDQAGAYLEETGESLSNYLSIYRQERTALLNRRGGSLPHHPESVATTWSLALQQVARDQPAAIELMRVCAFLAPDAIPEELLVEGAPHLGPVLQPVAADRNRFNEALAALLKYSLLRRDTTTHTLIIHRLVQAVILDELDEETQRRWAERVVRAVRQVFPFDEPAPWPRSQRYLAHALACETFIKQWNLTLDEAARVLNNAGWYLRARGQYREAEPLLREALAVGEKRYGVDHPNTSYLLNNLAELYWNQGKYEEAEALYQRDLAIREKMLGLEHPDTAQTLNNLANLYADQGKYAEAESLYQRALAIREQVLGHEHPDTAQTLNNLAALYNEQGKYEEAEPLYQRALAIREQVLGPGHPDTAQTLNNLAILYWNQGKHEEAEPLYQGALAVREKVLGLEHPDTAQTLGNLALLYADQGKDTEAEPLYLRALHIWEQALGPDHPLTQKVVRNYAILLRKMGRESEATQLEARFSSSP